MHIAQNKPLDTGPMFSDTVKKNVPRYKLQDTGLRVHNQEYKAQVTDYSVVCIITGSAFDYWSVDTSCYDKYRSV